MWFDTRSRHELRDQLFQGISRLEPLSKDYQLRCEFSTVFRLPCGRVADVAEGNYMLPKLPKIAIYVAVGFALSCALLLDQHTAQAANAKQSALPHWLVPVVAPAFLVSEFRAPLTAYGAGHRGLDYNVQNRDVLYSPDDGVIAYSGTVALKPVLVIEHPDGLKSAFEPVCGKVPVGTRVLAGEPVGVVCASIHYQSHCAPWLCLHFSARRDGKYLSPRVFIGGLQTAQLRY